MDKVIVDGDTTILLALIMSSKHPQRMLVIEIFMALGTEEK
jgi:hypothetical protein